MLITISSDLSSIEHLDAREVLTSDTRTLGVLEGIAKSHAGRKPVGFWMLKIVFDRK